MRASRSSSAPASMRNRKSGGEMLFATIFLVCFVILGGVVMYLSKTIDHGEARFDSKTGKQLPKDEQGFEDD